MGRVIRGPGGRFEKGTVGNPGGRPKGWAGFAAYISDKTATFQELADIALGIARDPDVDARDRIRALEFLADRGLGRPVQQVNVDAQGKVEHSHLLGIVTQLRTLPPTEQHRLLERYAPRDLPPADAEYTTADDIRNTDGEEITP